MTDNKDGDRDGSTPCHPVVMAGNLIRPLLWQVVLAGFVCKLIYTLDSALLAMVVTKLLDTLLNLATKSLDGLLHVVSDKLIDVLAVRVIDGCFELITLILLWTTTDGAHTVLRFALLTTFTLLVFPFLLAVLPYITRTSSPKNNTHMQQLATSECLGSRATSSSDHPFPGQQPVPRNQQTSPGPDIGALPVGQTLPAGNSTIGPLPTAFTNLPGYTDSSARRTLILETPSLIPEPSSTSSPSVVRTQSTPISDFLGSHSDFRSESTLIPESPSSLRERTLIPEAVVFPTPFTPITCIQETATATLPPPDFTTTRESILIPDDSSGVPSRPGTPGSPSPSDAEPPQHSVRSYQSRKEPVKHPTAEAEPSAAAAAPPAVAMAQDQPFSFHFPRPSFPKPTDFSLAGPFVGQEITYYLEVFQDAIEDHGLTKDAEICNRWLRWCDRETKNRVKQIWEDLGSTPGNQTWTTLKERMRKKWRFRDPRQLDDPRANIRRFFTTSLGATADETIAGLDRLEALVATIPRSQQAAIKEDAVTGFFNMLDSEVQGKFLTGNLKDKEDIVGMGFEEFSRLLIRMCRAGFTVQGRFTKLTEADESKPPASTTTPHASRKPRATVPGSQPEQPVTILKREAPPSTSMDDLASQIAKLTLLMGQKEPEVLKTYYQQPPPRSYSPPEVIPPERQLMPPPGSYPNQQMMLMPPPGEELTTNFMRTGRFNPQMGGSHDGQIYMGSRNAYNGQSGGGQGSYFTSNESILSGQPSRVPMLPYDQTRTGRPMQRYFCHGCGDPSHRCFPNQCPEYGAIEYFGLGFLKDGFLYIGRTPPSPQSQPDADMMVYPGLLRQAQQAGAIWQLVVAIYQRFKNDLATHPNFSEYCIKKDRVNFTAPAGLLQMNGQDPPWILQGRQFNQPRTLAIEAPPEPKPQAVVQTNISRMEDRGRPLFDYLDKGDVRVISYRHDDASWIQEAFPNKRQAIYEDDEDTTARTLTGVGIPSTFRHLQAEVEDVEEEDDDKENWTPETSRDSTPDLPRPNPLPQPSPPRVPLPGRRPSPGPSTRHPLPLRDKPNPPAASSSSKRQSTAQLETTAIEALSMLNETDSRKRPRQESTPPEDGQPRGPGNPSSGVEDSAAAKAARTILQPKAPRRPIAPTALPSSLLSNLVPKATSEQAISDIIASLLGKQIQVPLRQLLALNTGLVTSLQAFLEAQQHVDDVITLTETGVPNASFKPRHGEDASSTNVSLVGGVDTLLPPSSNSMPSGVPFFATLAHGELALMNADVLRDFLTLRQRPKDPLTKRGTMLHTAIDALSLSQRAALLLATRYHHLPRMFLQLADQSTKVCAIIDTGSECNLIPRSVVDSRGIAWTPTATVSIGLHGKESFTGECITNVWFGDHCVKTHFFILDDKARDYELILGMPFIRDTKLTFEYLESGAIRAKVILDNKMILASCFNPAFPKSA